MQKGKTVQIRKSAQASAESGKAIFSGNWKGSKSVQELTAIQKGVSLEKWKWFAGGGAFLLHEYILIVGIIAYLQNGTESGSAPNP